MNIISLLLLCLSIALSALRNLLSKNISGVSFGTRDFFSAQAVIFIFGGLVLTLAGKNIFAEVSSLTVLYAALYAILLVLAQWCYTVALRSGKLGVCSTVYSLGFIFPVLTGMLLWSEQTTLFNIIGIILVIPTIIISGRNKPRINGNQNNMGYIFPLVLAMISSGGLGIMQKLQQNSPYPDQRTVFVLLAFGFAGLISLVFAIFTKPEQKKMSKIRFAYAGGVGVAFACCNLLNTTLAGQLDSTVFFPVLNIGTILFSLALGIIFYREKPSKNDLFVLSLGVISILLITFK